MQIKNKKIIIIIFLINLMLFNTNLHADEFDISAKEIRIDNENKTVVGTGSVLAKDSQGKHIYADKIVYEKSRQFLMAEGNVKIEDNEGNILYSDKATYDKTNEIIVTYNNTKLLLKEGYQLVSKNVSYNVIEKTLNSNENSTFTDLDGNLVLPVSVKDSGNEVVRG